MNNTARRLDSVRRDAQDATQRGAPAASVRAIRPFAHAGFLQRKQADQSNQRRDLCHNRCACPVPVGQCTAGREHQLFFHETARRATLVVSPPHA